MKLKMARKVRRQEGSGLALVLQITRSGRVLSLLPLPPGLQG